MNPHNLQQRKRVLCGVLAVNLLFLVVLLPFMKMYETDIEHEKQEVQVELENIENELRAVKADIELINKSGDEYKALLDRGMLKKQDRLAAVRIFEKQRNTNNLNSLSYSFSEAEISKKTTTRKYNIQTTKLTLNISALLDRDFFKAVYGIKNNFPGAVIFKDIKIKRISKLKERHLEAIRKGEKLDLVKGNISFLWRTFIEVKNEDKSE